MGDPVPRLFPSQVCFVVDDVASAAADCAERFGWGPFVEFTARVEDAAYRDWSGRKVTDVALGMAGRVQVELIHVHEGRDAVAAYQARHGTGFQHLGIGCRDREAALRQLEKLGAVLDERNEYEGVRIAFVDVPTGPAMFELLQPVGDGPPAPPAAGENPGAAERTQPVLALDRATLVTADMDTALRFYAGAFRWEGAEAPRQTLRYEGRETRVRRHVGRAGALELELIEPPRGGDDPYAVHLARGEHGLVHAGGPAPDAALPPGPALECAWEGGEAFGLYDWAGGRRALQLRTPAAG